MTNSTGAARPTPGYDLRVALRVALCGFLIYAGLTHGKFSSTDELGVFEGTEALYESGTLAVRPHRHAYLGRDGRPYSQYAVGQSVLARRASKMSLLATFREPVEAPTWMSLWPISDHGEYSMFATNWRLRPSASPYMFGNVVDVAAAVSEAHPD